jgi:hypothetical protein
LADLNPLVERDLRRLYELEILAPGEVEVEVEQAA